MKCCEKYTAALSAFADEELNENERNELLEHLEHCEPCRDRLSELMILHTMFEELPELDAPEGFSERVLDRLHAEEHARSRHRRAWPRVLAACFALLVVTAAAWKLMPATAEKSDSTAEDSLAGSDSAGAPAASDMADADYSYTYSAVQKDGAQYDGSEYDSYSGSEDSAADLTEGAYVTVAVSESAAAEFLRERGMAVYTETERSVSFLVVPEAARELSVMVALGEEESAALAAADSLVIVEVSKIPAETMEEPEEITPAEEEVEP